MIASGGNSEHFLGSIIVTKDAGGRPKVVDGQQRLATTLMLIAAMRDYFHSVGDLQRCAIYGPQC